ncbi:MMPL family transporter [Streptomyces sp. NPDC093097]|uniref:MMPL family transporter n=1 Tax=Streptomyces sp. NPDC093097 TaxID=3366027 RepID=UPI0038270D46
MTTGEERAAGRSVAESLRITAKTSGHVVAVSGITVMLCVSGLLFSGLDVFRGLTLGTVLIVGLSVIGSVTVLPALLAVLGHRVDKGRIPWLGKRRTTVLESSAWRKAARGVVKRPLLWGIAAVVALVAMAFPMFSMRLQDAAVVNSLPRSAPTVDAAIRMQEAFPGAPTPARVAIWGVDGRPSDTPEVRAAVDKLHDEIASSGGQLAGPLSTVQVDDVLVVRIPLAGTGTDPVSDAALEKLRDTALPDTLGKVDGIRYAAAGRTAFAHDFAEQLSSRTFLVIGFVLILAFALLLVVFRSLAIPLVSIALNLLSMGASYGVLTWIFQDGHLSSLLGFTPYGGIAASAGVVTSAAVIMTAVFTVFITLSAIENKMMGVGMAVAILIDATLVRGCCFRPPCPCSGNVPGSCRAG